MLRLLSYTPRDHLPNYNTIHIGLGPSTSVINQNTIPQTCLQASLREAFSQLRLPFSDDSVCVTMTKKNKNQRGVGKDIGPSPEHRPLFTAVCHSALAVCGLRSGQRVSAGRLEEGNSTWATTTKPTIHAGGGRSNTVPVRKPNKAICSPGWTPGRIRPLVCHWDLRRRGRPHSRLLQRKNFANKPGVDESAVLLLFILSSPLYEERNPEMTSPGVLSPGSSVFSVLSVKPHTSIRTLILLHKLESKAT